MLAGISTWGIFVKKLDISAPKNWISYKSKCGLAGNFSKTQWNECIHTYTNTHSHKILSLTRQIMHSINQHCACTPKHFSLLSSITFKVALVLHFCITVPQLVDPWGRCGCIPAAALACSASLQCQPPVPSKRLSPAHLLLPGADQWSASGFLSHLVSSALTALNRQIFLSNKTKFPNCSGQGSTWFSAFTASKHI